MELTFESTGLQQTIDSLKKLPQSVASASALAINRAITTSRVDAMSRMVRQVKFPPGYFGTANDPSARLAISEKATTDRLEGQISARRRPTSLSRFSSVGANGRDVFVAVKAGKTQEILRGAFPIRLKSGTTADSGAFNRGIAYRLRPGETLLSSRAARQIGDRLYLLYGPSVDQVFQSVSQDIAPDAERVLRAEFIRQLDRLGVF